MLIKVFIGKFEELLDYNNKQVQVKDIFQKNNGHQQNDKKSILSMNESVKGKIQTKNKENTGTKF